LLRHGIDIIYVTVENAAGAVVVEKRHHARVGVGKVLEFNAPRGIRRLLSNSLPVVTVLVVSQDFL